MSENTTMVSARSVRRRDARLVPVAVMAWIAASFSTVYSSLAIAGAITLWSMAGLLLLIAAWGRGSARAVLVSTLTVAAIGAAMAAAVCTHVSLAQPARTAAASLEISGGRAVTFEVVAVGKIERGGTGWRFDATLLGAHIGQSSSAMSAPVLVRTATVPAGLDLGGRVRVEGTAWPADAGEREVLVIDASNEPMLVEAPSGVLAAAAQLRRGLAALTADLPQPAGGLVAGLAVGDTSAVESELDAAMKTSSLSHLTAVSGANCALVVGVAFGFAALCGARRGVRVGAGCMALAGFVVLVSPEPSVVRAAVMALIAMWGVLLGRSGAGMSLLTVTVVISLIADPWLASSVGFALSVAATGALLVAAGPMADGLARWMPAPLALAIAVPLAAQLVCGPLLVLIAPQVSLYGVLANMLAAPAAPLCTVLGLAACLTAGIPFLGAGLAALAWLPAAWIAATAQLLAALPGGVMGWPEGPFGLLALALVGAAISALIMRVHPRVRVAAVLVCAGAVGAALALGPLADAAARFAVPDRWAIAACNVGQGDAVVVRSGGEVLLIDTGPTPEPLARCLAQLGIDRIDLLVLTHFDLDHRGGVPAVVGRVDAVMHGPTASADDEAVLASLASDGARVVSAERGMAGTLGDSRWRVLWPSETAIAGNDASIVLEVSGGDVPTSLYLGDLSEEGQQLMSGGATLRHGYAVVKIAHHGSADQSPALYRTLAPAVALLSVGENDYGHPRAETLELIADVGARVVRTDQEGLIVLWMQDGELRLWRERAAAGVGAPG